MRFTTRWKLLSAAASHRGCLDRRIAHGDYHNLALTSSGQRASLPPNPTAAIDALDHRPPAKLGSLLCRRARPGPPSARQHASLLARRECRPALVRRRSGTVWTVLGAGALPNVAVRRRASAAPSLPRLPARPTGNTGAAPTRPGREADAREVPWRAGGRRERDGTEHVRLCRRGKRMAQRVPVRLVLDLDIRLLVFDRGKPPQGRAHHPPPAPDGSSRARDGGPGARGGRGGAQRLEGVDGPSWDARAVQGGLCGAWSGARWGLDEGHGEGWANVVRGRTERRRGGLEPRCGSLGCRARGRLPFRHGAHNALIRSPRARVGSWLAVVAQAQLQVGLVACPSFDGGGGGGRVTFSKSGLLAVSSSRAS